MLRFYKSRWGYMLWYLAAGVMLLLGIARLFTSQDMPVVYALLGGAIALWILLEISVRKNRIILTEKGVRMEKGLLTVSRTGVHYSDITNVIVKQTPLQRLLGDGTIEIHTSGEQQGIRMKSVAKPTKIEEVLQEFKLRHVRQGSTYYANSPSKTYGEGAKLKK